MYLSANLNGFTNFVSVVKLPSPKQSLRETA